MTTFPLNDCCRLLGVDPKTLRHWLALAQIPLHPHPTDGRIKALTGEQVQHLASVHARPLELPPRPTPALAAELLDKLSYMETQLASLQQQLTRLALDLLQQQPPEHLRQSTTELTTPAHGASPIPRRPRSRVLPLIEYGAAGRYVLICPTQGELAWLPDSPQWFAWLASLSSFQFVGPGGRFSAHRVFHKGPTRYWQAHRSLHQHRYKLYLGITESLTIACLEQAAATLQSHRDLR